MSLTPTEFQAKHAKRLKASSEEMRAGVGKVTVAPTQLAAAKQDKMKARLIESIDSGKWKAGLMKVDLGQWKDKMLNVGLARVSAGIDAAAPKVIDFATQFLPFVEKVKAAVALKPDLTLEDNIERMSFNARELAKFKKK